jgi:hypothetical protein
MINSLHENNTLEFYYIVGRTLRILLIVPPADLDLSGEFTDEPNLMSSISNIWQDTIDIISGFSEQTAGEETSTYDQGCWLTGVEIYQKTCH